MVKSITVDAPHPAGRLDDGTAADINSGATLDHAHLTGADIAGRQARAVDLKNCILENLAAGNAKLTKLGACDVLFKHPDLSTCDCSESSLLRTAFYDGRMTGWDINQGTLEHVVFERCKLDMVNFRASRMRSVRFVDCILSEADFLGAEMTNVEFQNCTLEKVEFSQCKLKHVDFRSSALIDICGWDNLRGAIIDSVQLTAVAPYLANVLGIVIED